MHSFQDALARLSSAQKTKRGVSLYSRFLNRPFGRVLAAACYVLGFSPNQVTLLSAAVTGGGIVLLIVAPPTLLTGTAVALLLVIGFALDSADGQVARLTGRGSLAGEWLDHVVDAAKIVALHGAVLLFVIGRYGVSGWMALPLAFQVIAVLIFFGGELQRLLLLTNQKPAPSAVDRPASTVRSIALLPADYGILAVSFVLVGLPELFIGVYALLLLANTGILVLLGAKWFRALSAP